MACRKVSSSSRYQPIEDKRGRGRRNPIVFADWPEEKKQELYDKYKSCFVPQSNAQEPEPFSACSIWSGSLQNGYPAISQGHQKAKVKMHILAAERKFKRVPTHNECVSHLCHRKKCINPDHLQIESLAVNNSRKGCHCAIKLNDLIINLCWHRVPCLRADTDSIGDFQPRVTDLATMFK